MVEKNRKYSKLCVAGFALGILGVFVSWHLYDSWGGFYFHLIFAGIAAIVGLILSIRGVRTFNWASDKGRWLGIAGIVISLVVLGFVFSFLGYMRHVETHQERPTTTLARQYGEG